MLELQSVVNGTEFRLFGGIASMGKTATAYRIAKRIEIAHVAKRF
jgi:hypothetical protein